MNINLLRGVRGTAPSAAVDDASSAQLAEKSIPLNNNQRAALGKLTTYLDQNQGVAKDLLHLLQKAKSSNSPMGEAEANQVLVLSQRLIATPPPTDLPDMPLGSVFSPSDLPDVDNTYDTVLKSISGLITEAYTAASSAAAGDNIVGMTMNMSRAGALFSALTNMISSYNSTIKAAAQIQ